MSDPDETASDDARSPRTRFDRAVETTRESLDLAIVPVVASLLSGTKIARVLAAGPGGGITFPFPPGLPTLWTYVSLPAGPRMGGTTGPLSLATFVPLFLFGLVLTSALEAGFLGSLRRRLDSTPLAFLEDVRRYTLRIVAVNLLRAALVFAAAPLLVVPPVALAVVVVLAYLFYGLPFEIVVRDVEFTTALGVTLSHARAGGLYARFGLAHLLFGAIGSLVLTTLVRNGGVPGVVLGTGLVSVPAVFVGSYGLAVFRRLDERH